MLNIHKITKIIENMFLNYYEKTVMYYDCDCFAIAAVVPVSSIYANKNSSCVCLIY